MFESLAAFRAHVGEPTMPLEQCSTCRAIPERCSREIVSSMVSDYDVDYGDERYGPDDVPQEVARLEPIAGPGREVVVTRREAALRCPTCRRLYHHRDDLELIGARNYSTTSYRRVDVDQLFRTRWGVSQRLPDRDVAALQPQGFFARHEILRFKAGPTWFSIDETNQLVELTRETLDRLVASDAPAGLDDLARARAFAEFAGEVDDPAARVVESFSAISWRESLTDEDREQIESARAASRIEPPVVERLDGQLVVRAWVVSKQRLICRIVTVRATGVVLEDAVIAENLPVK